jgi:single-stranded DNA-binding protein
MPADNHTTIVGNLVEDPELRFTNNGIAVANMRVAVTQRVQQGRRVARRRHLVPSRQCVAGPSRAPGRLTL